MPKDAHMGTNEPRTYSNYMEIFDTYSNYMGILVNSPTMHSYALLHFIQYS